MNKTIDFDRISDYLKGYDTICFSLAFGSAVENNGANFRPFSDLDIGIFTSDDIPLLEMGRIVAGLEKIVKRKIDLVLLNDLFKKKPNFAFRVIKTSRLLFTKDEDTFVDFKRKVFLYYLDVKPMLETVKAAMDKRLKTDTFGKRNYA